MKDILGEAISDFYNGNRPGRLWVYDHHGPKVEMPVATYFRNADGLPLLERIALQECRGSVLDIGAGAGSHALILQEKGLAVTALDISPGAAEVMRRRGVQQVRCGDFFALEMDIQYDTLLLLMNGIGLTGDLEGLRLFLQKARRLLRPGGQLLFDSSDVAYLYDGRPPAEGPYYGTIACCYGYKRRRTDWFTWLYVDQRTLRSVAAEESWSVTVLFEDDEDQYLVRLCPEP